MGMPSGMELLVIALVILLLFGGKKIPELAKGLGSGIKNFKKAVKDDEIAENVEEAAKNVEKKVESEVSKVVETKDKA